MIGTGIIRAEEKDRSTQYVIARRHIFSDGTVEKTLIRSLMDVDVPGGNENSLGWSGPHRPLQFIRVAIITGMVCIAADAHPGRSTLLHPDNGRRDIWMHFL